MPNMMNACRSLIFSGSASPRSIMPASDSAVSWCSMTCSATDSRRPRSSAFVSRSSSGDAPLDVLEQRADVERLVKVVGQQLQAENLLANQLLGGEPQRRILAMKVVRIELNMSLRRLLSASSRRPIISA